MLAIENTMIKETNTGSSNLVHSVKLLVEEIQQSEDKLFQDDEQSKIICLRYKGSSIWNR